MSDGTREQQFLVHVTLKVPDGQTVDLGVWDSWDGGDKDTDTTKYRSGGSPDEESLGGGNTYSDLTIGRNFRLARDGAIVKLLLQNVGKADVVAVNTPLDRGYTAQGAGQITAVGLLKTYQHPKSSSTSNSAAMITLVIEPNSIT